MNFSIGEVEDYNTVRFDYDFPVQVGYFSTDANNEFCDDGHQMKYLSMPQSLRNLHMDLNEGYSEFVGVYNDEEPSYNKLLRWIVSHKEELGDVFTQGNSSKGKIDFVCRRGVLTAINSTIYETFSDWSIYATKFQSVIYLCRMETENSLEQEASTSERNRLMSSWGYKFEQYIMSDSTYSNPDTSLPVNVNEKYYAMMKAKFENHGILFSGETDAVDPQSAEATDLTSMNRFIEIKTNYILRSEKMEKSLRIKMLKWYLQCYIAGIGRLICGFRNNSGIVREIEVYNVNDLPRIAMDLWSPDVCLNFGARFLNHVKQCVVKDDPKVVYKFYWKPGMSAVSCEELTPEYQFLPEWYISEISTE